MAVLQNRKRQLADQLSQHSPPTKRVKSGSQYHDSWQYPPEFWDGLSKIWLTRGALEELDRRTARRPSFPPPGPSGRDISHTATTRELARFAGHGGPDLSDLRGVRSLHPFSKPACANCCLSSTRIPRARGALVHLHEARRSRPRIQRVSAQGPPRASGRRDLPTTPATNSTFPTMAFIQHTDLKSLIWMR